MKQQTREGDDAGRGFEDLKAWQLARRVMLQCHELAKTLPAAERFDLVSQIRRSSKSVMANIAEGYGRYHYLDSLRFYYIARGSLSETLNHVITAHDLGYISSEQQASLCALARETERTLNSYISYVWTQKQGGNHYGERLLADATDVYIVAGPEEE